MSSGVSGWTRTNARVGACESPIRGPISIAMVRLTCEPLLCTTFTHSNATQFFLRHLLEQTSPQINSGAPLRGHYGALPSRLLQSFANDSKKNVVRQWFSE